ncbi:MAG: lytic transglycosylase domain-containing protein [Burkholderiales bacterium]|nr:lytic transglycosylase domain-containing protein [Burkholderiales bacterium]
MAIPRFLGQFALALILALPAAAPRAQTGDDLIVQAREALRRKDAPALAAARAAVENPPHPLAMWVEYWELSNRLDQAQQSEFDAFAARWPGTYVLDRLRNDWLLVLGKRRDWANVRAEYARFRMDDDREVSCYAMEALLQDGRDVGVAAREAWAAQHEVDDGCHLLGIDLYARHRIDADEAWAAAVRHLEFRHLAMARAAAELIGADEAHAVASLFVDPLRYLKQKRPAGGASGRELGLLALMRLAQTDPDAAAAQLGRSWSRRLGPATTATAWAQIGKQAAMRQLPRAAGDARRAWHLWDGAHRQHEATPWSDDLLAWQVRAALREGDGEHQRWTLIRRAIAAMTPTLQAESTWVYWDAQAQRALAAGGASGDAQRERARAALATIAERPDFYGRLAGEELGRGDPPPPAPAALSAAEVAAVRGNPGLGRALQLIALGLRSEGVREWNFTLRGMPERELLAAAAWACEREVWDRCISTSDRTRAEVDLAQRYPMPFHDAVLAQARAAGVDAAVLYGLMRQESRFVVDTRSGVGATGLMQLMPDTARITARRLGVPFQNSMLADRDTNLLLGAAYFKRVLDGFGGSLPLAAAAYNAGPGRPRRWRDGVEAMDPAAWTETIPFSETRDYVKKVLVNSLYYATRLGITPTPTLRSRLGASLAIAAGAAAAATDDQP